MGGTSMACPLVAGCAALARQYFVDKRDTSPSAALLKATLVNGALAYRTNSKADRDAHPNFHQGFGEVSLTTSLPTRANQAYGRITRWSPRLLSHRPATSARDKRLIAAALSSAVPTIGWPILMLSPASRGKALFHQAPKYPVLPAGSSERARCRGNQPSTAGVQPSAIGLLRAGGVRRMDGLGLAGRRVHAADLSAPERRIRQCVSLSPYYRRSCLRSNERQE
jgi:hypothetical protein